MGVRGGLVLNGAMLLLLPGGAAGWGRDGHEMIATMAETMLEAPARQRVGELLGGASMASIANWADKCWKEPGWGWSRSMHFTNVRDHSPECVTPEGYRNCTFVYERDCIGNDGTPDVCNAAAVRNFTTQLKNGGGSVNATVALKFVVHFVGDIHQPLHVAMDTDRGGNTMKVDFNVPGQGEHFDLHQVWDFGMIVRAEGEEGNQGPLIKSIMSRLQNGSWSSSVGEWEKELNPNQWVQEGLDVSTAVSYRFANGTSLPLYIPGQHYPEITLPPTYYDTYMRSGGPVEEQLAKSAVRLARLLNNILV